MDSVNFIPNIIINFNSWVSMVIYYVCAQLVRGMLISRLLIVYIQLKCYGVWTSVPIIY